MNDNKRGFQEVYFLSNGRVLTPDVEGLYSVVRIKWKYTASPL